MEDVRDLFFTFNYWNVLVLCHLYVVMSKIQGFFRTRAGICRTQLSVMRFVKAVLGLV